MLCLFVCHSADADLVQITFDPSLLVRTKLRLV